MSHCPQCRSGAEPEELPADIVRCPPCGFLHTVEARVADPQWPEQPPVEIRPRLAELVELAAAAPEETDPDAG